MDSGRESPTVSMWWVEVGLVTSPTDSETRWVATGVWFADGIGFPTDVARGK